MIAETDGAQEPGPAQPETNDGVDVIAEADGAEEPGPAQPETNDGVDVIAETDGAQEPGPAQPETNDGVDVIAEGDGAEKPGSAQPGTNRNDGGVHVGNAEGDGAEKPGSAQPGTNRNDGGVHVGNAEGDGAEKPGSAPADPHERRPGPDVCHTTHVAKRPRRGPTNPDFRQGVRWRLGARTPPPLRRTRRHRPGYRRPQADPTARPSQSVSQLARTTPRPSGTTARGSEADEGARVPASAPVEEPRSRPGRSSRALLANRIPNWGSPDESVHVGRYLPIWGSLRSIGTSGESRRPTAPRSWASPTSNATPRRRPPNDGPAATGASSRSCTSAFTPTARARRGASP